MCVIEVYSLFSGVGKAIVLVPQTKKTKKSKKRRKEGKWKKTDTAINPGPEFAP